MQRIFAGIFVGSGLLLVLAMFFKNGLPDQSAILDELRHDPRQEPTTAQPFTTVRGDIKYAIYPQFEYELTGLVVSTHDSSSWLDISHSAWGDNLNVKDLCVVWGDNVRGDLYDAFDFKSGDWTCYYRTEDMGAWNNFNEDQISNNHLLAGDDQVARAIGSANVGDQVRFSGYLSEYMHAGGFHRGTSTSRTDRGNGACETVFVKKFTVLKSANTFWRLLHRVSKLAMIFSLLAALSLFLRGVFFGHAPEFADHLSKGNQLAVMGKYRRAEKAFTRAIALDPYLAQAYHDRAEVRDMLGKHTEARADQAEAERLDRENELMGKRDDGEQDRPSLSDLDDDLDDDFPVSGKGPDWD